jgi:hypothetical protein
MLRPVPKVPLCMSRPASAATYCEHQPGARHCGGGDRRERDVDRSERTTHLPFIQVAHIEKRRPYLHQPTGLTRIDLAHRVRLHACAGPRPGQTEEQVLRPRESVDGGIGCPRGWLVAVSRRQDRYGRGQRSLRSWVSAPRRRWSCKSDRPAPATSASTAQAATS